MNTSRLAFFLVSGCLLLSVNWACTPDPLAGDTDLRAVEDHAFAESEFKEIQALFESEARLASITQKTNGYFCACSAADVTANPNGSYVILVDYGNGCACLDGRTRSGKLRGLFSGKWQSGATLSITPIDYSVTGLDNVTYEFGFEKTVSLLGPNVAGNPEVAVQVQNAVLSSRQGQIRWRAQWTLEWTGGFDDPDPRKHAFEVRGNATGTDLAGKDFSVLIVSPLQYQGACPHFVAGVLELTPAGRQTRVLDYGQGACDREATLTIGSFSRVILLR